MKLAPVIAIHGVGNHEPSRVSDRVSGAFSRASLEADVVEFNWDAFVDHSIRRIGGGVGLLDETAASLSNAAALPLPAVREGADRWLQRLGDGLYHSVFRVLLASGLTLLLAGPLVHLMVLLPSAVFGALPWRGIAWIRTATIVVAGAAAGVFIAMLALDIIRGVVIGSTAPVRVTLRRTAILLLQPVILLLTIPVSNPVGRSVLGSLDKIVSLALFGIVAGLVFSPLTGRFRDTMISQGQMILVLIAVAVIAGLHILARNAWIGGPLKVVLDIVRYMGSPGYRETLQKAFDVCVSGTRADAGDGRRRVVVLAHSLGSVIALDSLVNSPVWTDADEVLLVTLGSPIRRSFIRFFPGYLFPPAVDEAAGVVASRLRRFTWINMHRRWDYVGGGLGLRRARIGADICTGQHRRVFTSHSNYWADDVVAGALKRALDSVTSVPASARETAAPLVPVPAAARVPIGLARVAAPLATALTVAVVGSAVFVFAGARQTWTADFERGFANLQKVGTKALASVTYHQTWEGGGEDAYLLHHFAFDIPGIGEQLPPIEVQDGTAYDDFSRRVDYQGLAAFVLADCMRAEKKRWWQILRDTASIPCTRPSVAVSYDPADPRSFWLPEFPAQPPGRFAAVWQAVGMAIGGSVYAALCGLVLIGGAVALFRWFLGLNIRGQATPT